MLLTKTLRSTTFKLALISIAIFGALVLGLLGYVYWAAESYVRDQADRDVVTEQAQFLKVFAISGRDGLIAAISQRAPDGNRGDRIYLLMDAGFQSLAGNLPSWPSEAAGSEGWAEFDGGPRHALLRAHFTVLADGSHLLVGRELDDGSFMQHISTAMAFCVLLIAVLAGMAAILVTRRTVGRIESINATSRAIMQSGLHQRIPLRGTQDEWDELAKNLNSMLDRIETLMAEVKQVTDNVAHDLRTPLARMHGRLEKAYLGARDERHDQELIGEMLADLETVLRMFSALLRISQIEAYDRTAAFRAVDLVEIGRAVVELFDAAAEEKGMALEAVGQSVVLARGDRDLLFDALANLIDNALKYGSGSVTVEFTQGEHGPVISVADHGPGIPAEQRQHVCKRFYRLEQSRCTPGNGLGLSLVAAVARLHGATLELVDNAPGLKVELRFPPFSEATQEKPAAAEIPGSMSSSLTRG